MPTMVVPIEPKVLKWARESIGKDVEDAAQKLDISADVIIAFEAGDKKPRLKQLEDLAKFYKRPLAALLLTEPPPTPPKPNDFRTLPEGEPFSTETLLAIRRARRLQRIAGELAHELDYKLVTNISKAQLPENVDNISPLAEALAMEERKRVGISIETQYSWKSNVQALDKWREYVERFGVLIFQMRMPLKQTRGFTLFDKDVPIIVLNSKDTYNGRIFSLFHEYCHLMLNETGICGDMHNTHLKIEMFCNQFAGSFLVPKKALLNHKIVQSYGGSSEWPDDILRKVASDFQVSMAVILRRLVDLKKSTIEYFLKKISEWKPQTGGGGSGRNMAKECLRNNGRTFVTLALNAYWNERITSTDIADYLGTRIHHISELQNIIRTTD